MPLFFNTTGNDNTAFGYGALNANTTGAANAASGANALPSNTIGDYNTASGVNALYSNTIADYNTASGFGALYSNNGNSNTASGYEALYANTSGTQNTATGLHALASNTTGSNNIAEGYHGGYNLTTGSNNIDIGNVGVAGEGGAIRIGTTSTQTAAYIAGISTAKVTGSAVYVTSAGQLGVLASSERYKTAIAPMGSDTEKLAQLRPVSFKIKTDPAGTRQYGLIAEEVAKVYPELVIRDASGRIDGVRYEELAPMLLNEVQQQQQRIAAQAAQMSELKEQQRRDSQRQLAQLNDLKQELHAALGMPVAR